MHDCMLVDTHLHSDNSPDGHHSAMFICESAVAMNLKAISITDHCEIDVFYQDHYDRSTVQSYFEILKAREAYRGKLVVLRGIELGEPVYDLALTEKLLSKLEYDIVIGSLHNLRGMEDFYYMKSFTEADAKRWLVEYYDELIRMADWGKFDTMAHITYPHRYFFKRSGISVNMDDYKKQTAELFSLLAEKEIALEINTGGLRQPLNKLSPEADLVKRFRELGGKYVTFGSDAHYVEDLAKDFDKAAEAARYAGFQSCVFFQNRNPMEIPL